MNNGAMKASELSPAIKVWVPYDPKGVSIINRAPRDPPRWRVMLVFLKVSSIKQRGPASLLQLADGVLSSLHAVSSHVHDAVRSRSTSFLCIPNLAKVSAYRTGMHLNTCRITQSISQFPHRHITILAQKFHKKFTMRIKFPFSERASLTRNLGIISQARWLESNVNQKQVIALNAVQLHAHYIPLWSILEIVCVALLVRVLTWSVLHK